MKDGYRKIPDAIESFFIDVGHSKLKQSSIAAILILCAAPVPLAACLLILGMEHSAVAVSLDYTAIGYFYRLAIALSLGYFSLGLLGFFVSKLQKLSQIYIFMVAQIFAIGTFGLCLFLGVFTSPILITIIMTTGIGAVIFGKRQLLLALCSVFLLMTVVAMLQYQGEMKLLPIAKSMALAESHMVEWYLYVYAILIPLLSVIFSLIVRALMTEFRSKHEQLEALALKLAKYLSPQVYNSIFSGEKDVHIETYRKKLTVFFSDLKGFSTVTDEISSEQLSTLLNGYLNEMSLIALKYGGTIDKFIGDSIMIFFGDPHSNGEKQDALSCVLMALEMRERVHVLREEWKQQGFDYPLHLRIGINTGYCTVGNFGSDNRIDYTIIGGQVNLASRLEYSARDDAILISHETFGLVNHEINCVKKEKISVKGIHRPIQSYEVNDAYANIKQSNRDIEEQLHRFLSDVNYTQLNGVSKLMVLEGIRSKI